MINSMGNFLWRSAMWMKRTLTKMLIFSHQTAVKKFIFNIFKFKMFYVFLAKLVNIVLIDQNNMDMLYKKQFQSSTISTKSSYLLGELWNCFL